MTSGILKRMLQMRHRKDLFVTECKTGASWTDQQMRIMDAWAIGRSYCPVDSVGYEIKVTRSDFNSDKKWRDYLPHCNRFYWVCPRDLIQPTDIDTSVAGLIWTTKGGHKLRTVVVAPHREVDLESVLLYVLFSRATVAVRSLKPGRVERIEMAAEFLRDKIAGKRTGWTLGRLASKHIAEADANLVDAQWEIKSLTAKLRDAEWGADKLKATALRGGG